MEAFLAKAPMTDAGRDPGEGHPNPEAGLLGAAVAAQAVL